MPTWTGTGPFGAMGKWQVYNRDGTKSSSKVTIVRATEKWIMYKRKDRADPKGTLVREGTVSEWGYGVYRVAIGNFQYIEAEEEAELDFSWHIEAEHYRRALAAMDAREQRELELRRPNAARRIQRFLRDTTCNPIYAAARRSLDRLYQS